MFGPESPQHSPLSTAPFAETLGSVDTQGAFSAPTPRLWQGSSSDCGDIASRAMSPIGDFGMSIDGLDDEILKAVAMGTSTPEAGQSTPNAASFSNMEVDELEPEREANNDEENQDQDQDTQDEDGHGENQDDDEENHDEDGEDTRDEENGGGDEEESDGEEDDEDDEDEIQESEEDCEMDVDNPDHPVKSDKNAGRTKNPSVTRAKFGSSKPKRDATRKAPSQPSIERPPKRRNPASNKENDPPMGGIHKAGAKRARLEDLPLQIPDGGIHLKAARMSTMGDTPDTAIVIDRINVSDVALSLYLSYAFVRRSLSRCALPARRLD
jgi:hypothetical protein